MKKLSNIHWKMILREEWKFYYLFMNLNKHVVHLLPLIRILEIELKMNEKALAGLLSG